MSRANVSYVSGTSSAPLRYVTIGRLLDEAVERWPDRPALIDCQQEVRFSWRELGRAADDFAASLVELGLKPGERVGIWSPNRYEWVVTQFAAAKAGLVLVNINPAYRITELEYALSKVGCRALVHADRFKSSDYTAMLLELCPEIRSSPAGELEAERIPELRTLIRIATDELPGFHRYDDVAAIGGPEARAEVARLTDALQPDDAISIQFTSGTTGFPKGATLSHFNIVNNGTFTGAAQRLTEHDRLCIPVPLYHCFGMVAGVLSSVVHGNAMILPSEGFDPDAVLRAVAEERCTALFGVPTMFIAELAHPDFRSFDLTSLRTGIMAGAPCPIEVMKRVASEMHMEGVTIAYGMTETSPASFQTASDDPLERRVSTVGQVLPHVEAKVVDAEGRTVPRGTAGELCIRGCNVMLGYWEDPGKTADVIDTAGWMHTGDLATLDEEGYCNIVGRVKDMIIRGGENVYPREIEEFLYRHPEVEAVQVFGVPDLKLGEEICAWIKVRAGCACSPEDIREFCRVRIAHYKVPRYVKFVEIFPMTVTGKAQKFVMRDMMKAELGLDDQRTA
jgi:fatty-acyl-CoA synthase